MLIRRLLSTFTPHAAMGPGEATWQQLHLRLARSVEFEPQSLLYSDFAPEVNYCQRIECTAASQYRGHTHIMGTRETPAGEERFEPG